MTKGGWRRKVSSERECRDYTHTHVPLTRIYIINMPSSSPAAIGCRAKRSTIQSKVAENHHSNCWVVKHLAIPLNLNVPTFRSSSLAYTVTNGQLNHANIMQNTNMRRNELPQRAQNHTKTPSPCTIRCSGRLNDFMIPSNGLLNCCIKSSGSVSLATVAYESVIIDFCCAAATKPLNSGKCRTRMAEKG